MNKQTKTKKFTKKKKKVFWILLISSVILILLCLIKAKAPGTGKSLEDMSRRNKRKHNRSVPAVSDTTIRNQKYRNKEAQETEIQSTEAQETKTENAEAQETEIQSTEAQETKTESAEVQETEIQSTEAQEMKTENAEVQETEIQSTEAQETKTENVEAQEPEPQSTEAPQETEPQSVKAQEKPHVKWMQRIAYGFYLFVVLGMCALPLLAMGKAGWQGDMESGLTVSMPNLYEEDEFNWNYLAEAGEYFNGHFAFRPELVALDSYVKTTVFGVSPISSVIAGEDGWLYYTATLDDFWHNNPASDRMLFNIAHNISLMQDYTESLGIKFVFTVAPNKNSLYYENMPSRLLYRINAESDMDRLLDRLDQEQIHYVDLFSLFEEQEEVLYYQRDSHWNQKGAVMVYNALLDACGKEHETYENSRTQIVYDYYGDLNRMLFPTGGKPEQDIRYLDGKEWMYREGESVEDSLVVTESPEGSQTLLMYRDSFGNSLLPLMAGEYAEAVFSKIVPYTMTDLAVYWPDVVIVEKVERHLPAFAEAPPLMSAPEVELDGERIPVESNTTIELSKVGSYWTFSGIVDEDYLSTDSRIYLEMTDADGMRTYEAFCVSLTDDGFHDNGYILYRSEISLSGDSVNVKVMTEREDEVIVLKEEEITLISR